MLLLPRLRRLLSILLISMLSLNPFAVATSATAEQPASSHMMMQCEGNECDMTEMVNCDTECDLVTECCSFSSSLVFVLATELKLNQLSETVQSLYGVSYLSVTSPPVYHPPRLSS